MKEILLHLLYSLVLKACYAHFLISYVLCVYHDQNESAQYLLTLCFLLVIVNKTWFEQNIIYQLPILWKEVVKRTNGALSLLSHHRWNGAPLVSAGVDFDCLPFDRMQESVIGGQPMHGQGEQRMTLGKSVFHWRNPSSSITTNTENVAGNSQSFQLF